MNQSESIEAYIEQYPLPTQEILKKVRQTIRAIVPEAGEKISYGIPTFTLKGNLVHYAAYAHHIGFYPGADGIAAFKKELNDYNVSKGTVQFPLDKPIPYDLIERITRYRVEQSKA